MFDTKLKKLHYLVIWLENWLEKSGFVSVRNETKQRTTDPGSRLVDPVDDEDVEEIRVLILLGLQLTMRSKEMEEY